MPYRQGNFSFVIDSSFRPFSMQEMLVPFTAYKDAFERTEEAYNDLTDKADKFKYLSETLPEGSKARQIYEGYADNLSAQATDLAQNGLTMNNRRALTNLRRRYSGEIGRLAEADVALRKEQDLRRQMATKDGSMLYAMDNLSIDDFLDNGNPNLYGVSGNELYARGAQAGRAASSRIYSSDDDGSTLGGYYRKWVERNGYSKQSMDAFRANISAIPELQMAVDDILKERGVTENLTGSNLERARQSVINGIIDGAIYQEKINPVRDLGKMTAAEDAADKRAKEQLAMQKRAWEDERNIKYTFKTKKDANGNIMKDANGNPIYVTDSAGYPIVKGLNPQFVSGKKTPTSRPPKLLPDRSFDTSNNNWMAAPSGQNAVDGQEISLEEAMELAPSLVSETGSYKKYYKYYKNGTKITRRAVATNAGTTENTQESNNSDENSNDY